MKRIRTRWTKCSLKNGCRHTYTNGNGKELFFGCTCPNTVSDHCRGQVKCMNFEWGGRIHVLPDRQTVQADRAAIDYAIKERQKPPPRSPCVKPV